MVAIDSTDTLIDVVLKRKVPFIGVFFAVFLLSFTILYGLDFYPELVTKQHSNTMPVTSPPANDSTDTSVVPATLETTSYQVETEVYTEQESEPVSYRIPGQPGTPRVAAVATAATDDTEATFASVDSLPSELVIDALGTTMPVLNPVSRTIDDLDAALLDGVVRHPDSATFTNEGTIFILGHSSYLPNVFNQNYQAFNGIQNLSWGDTLRLRSNDAEYIYRVDSVYHAKADDVTVPIAGTGPRLTLATCNSFGTKDDRYIVEASLVGKKTL